MTAVCAVCHQPVSVLLNFVEGVSSLSCGHAANLVVEAD